MTAAIVRVDFHGDAIECVRRDDTVWVSLASICERLGGLDVKSQRRKLQEIEHMARVAKIAGQRSDGQGADVWAIDLDGLPAWLMSISLNRVSADVREALKRYQAECAAVLRDHFFGAPAQPEPAPLPTVVNVDKAAAAITLALEAGAIDKAGAALRLAALVKASSGYDVLAVPEGLSWQQALPQAADLAEGESFTVTKNVDTRGHYTASALAAPYGVSSRFVGDVARNLHIFRADGWGKAVPQKRADGKDLPDAWVYNEAARAKLAPHLEIERDRRASKQLPLGKRGAS